ncbi:hypothetical protein QQX98_004572 [Neonectria punicea]|uniref:Xylanolytic transcriptional activator regulatory domain-containing protein n=1 Tax=Neonectria punicea TaxID=979145 RepID=A0ABR1H9B3_9HYPO
MLYPCKSCADASQTCEYPDQDRKRRPVSLEYVTALETRVAWLESLLLSVKTATLGERDSMLHAVSFGNDFPSLDDNPRVLQVASALSGATRVNKTQRQQHQVRLELGPEGSLIYHGPTSIYRVETDKRAIPAGDRPSTSNAQEDDNMAIPPSPIYSGSDANFDHVAKHFGINMEDELITNALLQFFKWQYPHFMFIYREAFLREHFGDRIAFRMAQDLGFQKDPKHWVDHDSSLVTPEDLEVRRRIYWGCYTSDKTISIVLGRPVQLYHDDAEVELMERLPDFPEMDAWLSAGIKMPASDQHPTGDGSTAQPLVLCFKEQIVLSKIIERMLATLFSTRSNLDSLGRRVCIDTLNLDMCRWQESLPDSAKWNRWEPPKAPLLPSVAALQ